jgi:hypothetical protein
MGSGYHQALQRSESLSFEQSFVVDPDAVGYYLCVFPRKHSSEELALVSVQLSVLLHEDQASSEELFERFFGLLGAQEEQTTFENSFHLGLLRALASELHLGLASTSDDSRAAVIRSLSQLLDQEGFATEKLGLECLVEVIDSILLHRGLPQQPNPQELPVGHALYRTFAAM